MKLDEILSSLQGLPPEQREALVQEALAATAGRLWTPNPGPQYDAYTSEADEVFYGGQAGGGKSDLALGLAIEEHQNTLILRRLNKDAVKLTKRFEEILGTRDGWNGQLQQWKLKRHGRKCQIDFGGCEYPDDKQKYKGDPHDLIEFDEITDFLEEMYRFIIGWNRSVDPNQRCRVVCTGNPPTNAEGLWVIKYWGPWLDPTHPNPAKPGELRWYTTIGGVDTEVDGPGPHRIPGERKLIRARSRTFIPAALDDNPDLAATDYDSVLAAMPQEIRQAYRDGRFDSALKDKEFQLIPTAWVVAAEQRWKPDGWKGLAMTAMGLDPAGGGRDSAVLIGRYGGWYTEPVSWKGEMTSDGDITAGKVVQHRKNGCPVVIDVGGGYAGSTTLRFKDNEIPYLKFNGANASAAKTKDGMFRFANKRAEACWRMREELDPDQQGGSAIALPPIPELRSDLTVLTWRLTTRGILVLEKDEIKKLIGRSPGMGDAAIMCLSEGNKAAMKLQSGGYSGRLPVVNRGYQQNHKLLRR